MTTVLEQLRQAVDQRTEGFWTKGASTHNAVALTEEQRAKGLFPWDRAKLGYRIADFHHGRDNWSVCWLMAHAEDLVRFVEIESQRGKSPEDLEELARIWRRLGEEVADPEAWPL